MLFSQSVDYRHIGVRWTIGDADPRGFEALRLSILGAQRQFGDKANYAVCVNAIAVETARRRTGPVPQNVRWLASSGLPDFLLRQLGQGMAEGVAWKLAPLRLFPDCYEIALDNDCILWDVPDSMRDWLQQDAACLIAGDVVLAHGAFTHLTRHEPRNTGIRGFPPGYDLGAALAQVLERHPLPLVSELDEQGLQVVALDLERPAFVVPAADVSICSPFHPRKPELGRCGAHFVGLNLREIAWDYFGRPATEWIGENWHRHRVAICQRLGVAP